jgi:hypothetical protein
LDGGKKTPFQKQKGLKEKIVICPPFPKTKELAKHVIIRKICK